ncbi:MAG: hypothetical protein AAF620_01265 [Bacteroidota bacterium]
MCHKPISDKALIKLFLKSKGIKRQPFCSSLGLANSYLDADNTITVENFRKMLQHPAFEDFNLNAFFERKENLQKEVGTLSEAIANPTFIMKVVKMLTELSMSNRNIEQQEARILLEYLNQLVRDHSNLSEDYQALLKKYEKMYKFIGNEAKR